MGRLRLPGGARITIASFGSAALAGAVTPALLAAPAAASPKASGHLTHALANPDVGFVLLTLAFVALFLWVAHPRLHPSLILGAISLILAVAVLRTLPVRWVGLLLLAVASALLVLDLKVRAHGILTAAGVIVLAVGGVLLFKPGVPAHRVSPVLLIALPVLLGAGTLLLLRAMAAVKEEPLHAGAGSLLGLEGTAESALAPKGRVRLRGESWAAESTNGPVDPGGHVRVMGVRGLTLEVVEEPLPAGPPTGSTTNTAN